MIQTPFGITLYNPENNFVMNEKFELIGKSYGSESDVKIQTIDELNPVELDQAADEGCIIPIKYFDSKRFKRGTYEGKKVGVLRKSKFVFELKDDFVLVGRFNQDTLKVIPAIDLSMDEGIEAAVIIQGLKEDYEYVSIPEPRKNPNKKQKTEHQTGFKLFHEGVQYYVKYHNTKNPHTRSIVVEKVGDDYMMVRENNKLKKFLLEKTEYLTPGDLEYVITIDLDMMKKFGLGDSSIRVSEYPSEFSTQGYFSFQYNNKLYCVPDSLITFKKKVFN